MTAVECLRAAKGLGDEYQRAINTFVDEFRRATPEIRKQLMADPVEACGQMEGLVAAVVSALCRETELQAPWWVETVNSPEPFFAFPAHGFRLRVRLLIESPAPFRIRNVFVPDNYLARA